MEAETEEHLCWECPKLEDRLSQSGTHFGEAQGIWLAEQATSVREAPCLWLRGLMPSAFTLPKDPAISVIQQGGISLDQLPTRIPFLVFLDGSGGRFSSDPRLRRCGWGIVVIIPLPHEYKIVSWVSGTLVGAQTEQTVPRSEITALMVALERLPATSSFELFTDNKMVYDTYLAGPRSMDHAVNVDLWGDEWKHVTRFPTRPIVHKVKAHAKADDFRLGRIMLLHFVGNALADIAAGNGARMNQASADDIREVTRWDWAQELILERLLAVYSLVLEQAPRRRPLRVTQRITPLVRQERRQRMLKNSGHKFVTRGRRTWCIRCLEHSPCQARRHPCKGMAVYRGRGPGMRAIDRLPLPDTPLRRKLHVTHHLQHHRGGFWCVRCGAYATCVARNLGSRCPGHASTAGLNALRRIGLGKFPDPRLDWPRPA